MAPEPLVVAGATRPFPGQTANGDAWAIHCNGGSCRIALVDGLGHGPAAQQVAHDALRALDTHPCTGPVESLSICHNALRGTRGAVATIAQVDLAEMRLSYAGVGNVDGRLWQRGGEKRLSLRRGVLGANLPTLRLGTVPLAPDWLLVLHSDGVSASFAMTDIADVGGVEPRALAEALIAGWGRLTDDATVVVVRPR